MRVRAIVPRETFAIQCGWQHESEKADTRQVGGQEGLLNSPLRLKLKTKREGRKDGRLLAGRGNTGVPRGQQVGDHLHKSHTR